MKRLARKAIAVAGTPDAGIWEYRTEWKPQTFSSADVLGRRRSHGAVAERHAPELAPEFRAAADKIREQLLASALERRAGHLRRIVRRT